MLSLDILNLIFKFNYILLSFKVETWNEIGRGVFKKWTDYKEMTIINVFFYMRKNYESILWKFIWLELFINNNTR